MGEEVHSCKLQLSDLPDEILIRILSLLPTESAVRTCLLLKSGQHHLWKFIPCLEFHEDDMFLRGIHFINFVDKVMNLRDHSSSLLSFSLQYFVEEEEEDDAFRIETWITKAVQCNVEELTLSLRDHHAMDYVFPCCMFSCQSLVKLDITFPFVNLNAPSPPLICLPSLKYLRLEEVYFTSKESTEMLLSSPLLEELILESCFWYNIESISVCSSKLQVLEIYDQNHYSSYGTQIRVIGDNLKCFSYSGDLRHEYRICASSSSQLSKVEIYVDRLVYLPPNLYNVNTYTILQGLSRTRNLALSDHFLEGLSFAPDLLDTIPIFECLTKLDIRVYEEAIRVDSLELMKIYERCPHLQYLDIGKLSHTVRSPQLSPIPLCFCTNLKKIMIHSYVSGDEEDDVGIYVLLNSCLVLEELVIYCERDEENGFHEGGCKIRELQDRLNRHPRVSKDCIIWVSIYHE